VAKGLTSKEHVEEINSYLANHLPLDEFRVCFHVDENHCACRKPKPGALLQAAQDHQIDLPSSYMVGDRWRDIEAGQNAGCRTIFIDYGYAEKQPSSMNFTVHSLKEAAQLILGDI
jgi:D-glycero-D-manno-heptose 1,7-bisphosphate phosphatase